MEGRQAIWHLMYVESWKSNLLRSGSIARYWLHATSVLKVSSLRSIDPACLRRHTYLALISSAVLSVESRLSSHISGSFSHNVWRNPAYFHEYLVELNLFCPKFTVLLLALPSVASRF